MELRLSVLLSFVAILKAVNGLTITVFMANGTNLAKYTNDNSALEGRAYNLPETMDTGISGRLVIPADLDPCSYISPVIANTTIAFIDRSYYLCPNKLEQNLLNASYVGMIVYTIYRDIDLDASTSLPQAMITDSRFGMYLEEKLAQNDTGNDIFVRIWDDSALKLQKLFIIFAIILVGSITAAIVIACLAVCCKWCVHKWRTRGLSRWRIRQIPRRKYRKAKETTETCSICLEDFKEGCSIRVLPCSHVFHPKCVDEWLMKWNRTCPLCKATINRNKGASNVDLDETSQLLSEDGLSSVRASFSESNSNYGATGADPESIPDSPPSISLVSSTSPTNRDHHFMTPSEGEPLSFQTADELQSNNPIEPLVQ